MTAEEMPERPTQIRDELGAHVSVAGGVENAPERAADIGSMNVQIFTKQANRWAEPEVPEARADAFRVASADWNIVVAGSHDSYLINLASPDEALWERSYQSFRNELDRSRALGLDFVVTHPGNATDGDSDRGTARNAEGIARALEEVPDPPRVLLELTAGSGTSIGGSFEGLAAILSRIPEPVRHLVGVCFDTCHAYAAGYDLVSDYAGVWMHFDDVLGLERLELFHLNDSKHPLGARKDRHEHIGQGTLGEEPFRRLMTDDRFAAIPKLLETPKGDDLVTLDRRNLALLRSYRQSG